MSIIAGSRRLNPAYVPHVSAPIRLQSILDELSRYDTATQPTVRVPSAKPSIPLARDEGGHQYSEIIASAVSTPALMALEVERFMSALDQLPTKIVLSTLRYVGLGNRPRLYKISDVVYVPIYYVLNADFDIRVYGV